MSTNVTKQNLSSSYQSKLIILDKTWTSSLLNKSVSAYAKAQYMEVERIMKSIILIVISLLILAVPNVMGQSVSTCGTLVQGSECLLLSTDGGGMIYLDRVDGHVAGDRIHVGGHVIFFFVSPCGGEETISIRVDYILDCSDWFEGCGVLQAGAEAGCLLLQTDTGITFLVFNSGGFSAGDRVWVRGTIDWACFSICMQGDACLIVDSIRFCENQFDGCGRLVQGIECVLFEADEGGLYLLDNLGGFSVGDKVNVKGVIDSCWVSFCATPDGCIINAEVRFCEPDFDECGVLVQTPDCVMLQTETNGNVALVDDQFVPITDLGPYGIGDTVRILGANVAITINICGEDGGIVVVYNIFQEGCVCSGIRGNADGDFLGSVDIADLLFLVNYIFLNGCPPPVMEEADLDGSGGNVPVIISDLVYLVQYMYYDGPPPVACP